MRVAVLKGVWPKDEPRPVLARLYVEREMEPGRTSFLIDPVEHEIRFFEPDQAEELARHLMAWARKERSNRERRR